MLTTKNQNQTTDVIDHGQLQTALSHIDDYWEKLTKKTRKDTDTLIGLPYPYVTPSAEPTEGFLFNEMYYWDNLFIVRGMIDNGRVGLAECILRNEIYLIKRFGLVPNAGRFYMLSRSQPPSLTMQAFMVYEANGDKQLLDEAIEAALDEYKEVWTSALHPHNRRVFKGLSRYYDINVLHQLAEAESGWDYTPRFDDRALDFIPVDLNAWLWRYETDFAAYFEMKGQNLEAHNWRERAEARKQNFDKYLWRNNKGFFFDYDYVNEKPGQVWSLAGYVPMYVGMVSQEQASELVEQLAKFETPHGLATTPPEDGSYDKKQWAAPNGWAPLNYLVVEALDNYDFKHDADRLRVKWLKTNLDVFKKTGNFYEKYNVADPSQPPMNGVYPAQVGFAMTNAVFEVFASAV